MGVTVSGGALSYSSIDMTQLEPTLMVRRMTVFAGGKPVYDEPFHAGVNIVRGANSSGKSTVADFLFFGLGGDVSMWKPEAERCSDVFLEVAVNGAPLTLRRSISKSPRQPMMLFWGALEDARKSAADGWQVFSFQRSEEKESFSQVLFRAMGFPEVRSDMESNITMHQILRLIYVDQLSMVEDLMRTEHFDTPLTREAVRDLLFGLYDDTLYRCELKLRNKKRDLERANTEYNSAMGVLGQTGHEMDMDKVNAAMTETDESIVRTQVAIDEATTSSTPAIEAEPDDDRDLSATLVAARRARVEAEGEIHRHELNIEDSREFITTIEDRLVALDQSMSTREILGELPLTLCPHCLKPLPDTEAPDACFLCKQPLGESVGRTQAMRMKQELVFQQRESESLLREKEQHLTRLTESLPGLVEKERSLQRQYNAVMQVAQTSHDQRRDALLVQKGMLENQLQFLHMQARAIGVLERLKGRIVNLKSDIRRLEMEIATKQKAQESRRGQAFGCIHDVALALLRADLPREEAFQSGQKVDIDFRKNAFAVDDRNQFSASSIGYLKNCIHYAIFFGSLRLPFFRYPRFIICDNMEDKGMEEERSQNFQRTVVNLSNQAGVEHQIIFTTSMIDPDLDRSKMCVGPHYDHDRKSLQF